MSKYLLLLLLLARIAWSGCSTLSIPTDYLTVDAFRRANQAANWTATANAHNNCKDSVNLILSRITGLGSSLWFKPLQDYIVQVDADNNGTHKFYVLNGAADTLFRIREDSAAKFFGPVSTGALSATTGSFSSTLVVSGQSTLAGATFNGGSSGQGGIYTTGTVGLALQAKTGSSYDFSILGTGGVGSYIMRTATGTTNAEFPSNVTIGGTGSSTGLFTASGGVLINGGSFAAGRIYSNATDGTVITGTAGSSTDLVLQNRAGGAYMTGAANAQGVTFPGLVTLSASGATVPDGSGIVTSISSTSRGMILRGGTVLNIGENGGWSEIRYRLPTGGIHQFQINGTTVYSMDATALSLNSPAYLYVSKTGNNQIALNSTGVYGFISNPSASTWALAYGSTPTSLGTSALTWDNTGAVSVPGTLGVTQKLTGSDSVVGVLGFRAGNTAASNTILYRSGADMWTTPDSLSAAALRATDSLVGGSARVGALKLTGRFIDQTTTVTSGTTALGATHSTVFADATAGNITLNLPAASGNAGLTYTVFKTDASTNTVTVDGNSSETIGGALTVVMGGNTGNSQLSIVCTGSAWVIKTLYEEGSFTAAATGMSACTNGALVGSTCTATAYYIRNNKLVHVYGPPLLGTSNNTSLTVTGLPSFLSTARQNETVIPSVVDNTNNYTGFAILSGTTFTFSFRTSLTAYPGNVFTSSGLKGHDMFTFMYTLQ